VDIGAIDVEPEVEGNEEAELDAKAQKIAEDGGDGDDEAGEIDLAKHGLVGRESRGGLVQAVGEVEPADVACHVEQGLGYAVGAHLGNATEDDHIHDDGEDGLDDVPQRTEDGLLILYDNVTLDEQLD